MEFISIFLSGFPLRVSNITALFGRKTMLSYEKARNEEPSTSLHYKIELHSRIIVLTSITTSFSAYVDPKVAGKFSRHKLFLLKDFKCS